MSTEDDLPAGWGQPKGAMRSHYFPVFSMVSLCSMYRHYEGPREHPDASASPSDCPLCGLALAKIKAASG